MSIIPSSIQASPDLETMVITKSERHIEIPPNSYYVVSYYPENMVLEEPVLDPYASSLPTVVQHAIAKAPCWIHRDLTRQFLTMEHPEPYAELLLQEPKQFTDELAFCIAHCSPQSLPSLDLLRENVHQIYENDQWIHYADIIDYDLGSGTYYSTIRYAVLEHETMVYYEHPREIYYWYVVHPITGGENAEYIYDTFWREYLFNHNDREYPLLKEKLSSIQYYWDGRSYAQPANRLWTPNIQQHPTAIEAISYWIGKTIPYQAVGDRPNQPNVIAHEHNGWCGELQRLAVAAQRAALIPTVGVCNIGEDHVWREFYERGWYQNDNWWTDGGGTVDQPEVYSYGWGKGMSAVFAWEGDDSIYDVTPRYIHSEDRVTVTFQVTDLRQRPIDGARVTATVMGLKDVTWYKNQILVKLKQLWEKLPNLIKRRILETIYDKIQTRIQDIPDVVDGLTITTWNYTNAYGECTFELGGNCSYFFVIQQGNLRKPWQLARHNTIRFLTNPLTKTYAVVFPNLLQRTQRHQTIEQQEGSLTVDVSYDATGLQWQSSVRTDDVGRYETAGGIDVFVVDKKNFNTFQKGRTFTCSQYFTGEQQQEQFTVENKEWYMVFHNTAQATTMLVNYSLIVNGETDQDSVHITTPFTDVFSHPVFCVGDTIAISGVSTDTVMLNINETTYEVVPLDASWTFEWNTTGFIPGKYLVAVTCGTAYDELTITLLDLALPTLDILFPGEGSILTGDVITIGGESWDNTEIQKIEIGVDSSAYQQAMGTTTWSLEWDSSSLALGDHEIFVKATDVYGHVSIKRIHVVYNETGHTWKPQIHQVYHLPGHPTNVSNVVVYANVTSSSPFSIQDVVFYLDNGTKTESYTMFCYGVSPVQDRHEEDPLFNQSNAPCFGFELGQLPSGITYHYWILACDSASNVHSSDIQVLTIA